MDGSLATTNVLLGIVAVVSAIEGMLLVGAGIAGFIVYRRVTALVEQVEARHVTPAMVRVNAILDDVKDVSAKVREETERVDWAINRTIDRVDDTADRVRSNVRARTSRIIGLVLGARTAIETMLRSRAA